MQKAMYFPTVKGRRTGCGHTFVSNGYRYSGHNSRSSTLSSHDSADGATLQQVNGVSLTASVTTTTPGQNYGANSHDGVDRSRESRAPSPSANQNSQGDPRSGADWSQAIANIGNPQGDPRLNAGWNEALGDNDNDGVINSQDSTPNGSGGGGRSQTPVYQAPRDTRTQQQKIAAMNRSLASAKQAAAGGDPRPLQDFDSLFGVTRDAREYKRAFYADYSSNKLSSATETEIRNWFASQDANNDGLVQTSEMTENARNIVGGYAGADNALSAAEGVSYHVGKIGNMDAKLDASGLPELTKREIRSWFIGLDKNNDGAVSSSEMGAPALAINTEAGYMGDNSLSVDEAIAYHKNRQAGMDTKLANSGLSRDTQGHIRDYFLENDANKDGHLTQGEMAHPNHWVVNGSAITQDGKYTLEESINLHRGREGKRALTNEEIAGTALSYGNDTPTDSLDPIAPVNSPTAPTLPNQSDNSPSAIGYAIRSDGDYFGAPKFIATAADGTELSFIEQKGRNSGKYYLHKGRPVASIEDAVEDYHTSIGYNANGSSSSTTAETTTQNPMPVSAPTNEPISSGPPVINGPAQVSPKPTPAPASASARRVTPTNDDLIANSGLSTARKNEIKTWWNGRDANKDGFIQKNEMGAYAQKENAAALADGKLSMDEAIKYHQDRDLKPNPVAIGKVIDTRAAPTPQPTSIGKVSDQSTPVAIGKVIDTPQPAPAVRVPDPGPKTNDQLLASSGLSTTRKNEIKTWWNGRDANKDNYIQTHEMGAYAQKENAAALADGKLSMNEAIKYHQDRDLAPALKPVAATNYSGRGTNLTPSMPASAVKPTNNSTGFSLGYR